MIYLIKGAEVWSPAPLGTCDILLAGDRICDLAPNLDICGTSVTVVEANGLIAMPGMVDSLVHFSGGGGEGGFHTRTPEMPITDATLAGVTTVIGALGTDATTRTHADLLAKAHALHNEGLSTYCYSGSYQVPVRTLTGKLTEDIIHIDKMIGVGEIAIADHRASQPTAHELMRLAADARVGGMLSGKAGIVSIHVGEGDSQLTLLHEVADASDIPPSQFYPTHMNRNSALLEAGLAWARRGGYLDFTTSTNQQFIDDGEIPAAHALAKCLQAGIPVSQLTMSSDGNASLPVFDGNGQLVGLEVGKVGSLHQSFKQLVHDCAVPLDKAIASVTNSPANILKLSNKGRLAKGLDADLVLLDKQSLNVHSVWCRGQCMVADGHATVTGTFQ